jgi:hypothetical protein
MLQQEYRTLITALIGATDQNKVHWERGRSFGSYQVKANPQTKILVDSYFAQNDNVTNNCINILLLNCTDDKVLDNFVICNEASQLPDYTLVKQLYDRAKGQFDANGINSRLAEITQSLNAEH